MISCITVKVHLFGIVLLLSLILCLQNPSIPNPSQSMTRDTLVPLDNLILEREDKVQFAFLDGILSKLFYRWYQIPHTYE
jgi:hypothetical protein